MTESAGSGGGEDAFTLLELLVAMVIVSLMTAYAFDVISRFKDIRRIEVAAAEEQAVQMARKHLRTTIGGMRARFKQTSGVQGELVFRGGKDSLMLSNTLDERLVFGGLHDVTYRVVEGTLSLDVSHLQASASQRQNVLLANVASVTFRYFGRMDDQLSPSWHDEWTAQKLPSLIRIVAEMKNSDGARWLPLDIAIEAAAPTN
jgi:prepilin-type N-terminal cleavage/methylation domain-containing protein